MASLRKTALIVVCFAAVAGACSSGDQAAAPEGPLDGGRLAGPPDVPALEVIRDYVVDEGVPEELIERTASGILVARNQLDVAFRLGATVGEINAAVDSVDGEIIGLVENAAVVLIRFPDPGNTVRLLEIREELEARDSVEFAALDPMPVVSMVPENLEPETDGLPNTNPVDHHLAARGHAAWNARRAIAQAADKPTFILSDLFCDGDLGEEFDVSIISSSGLDRPGIFQDRVVCTHGYAVLSVVAGRFGGDRSPRQLATGMFPDKTDLVVLNRVSPLGISYSGFFSDYVTVHAIRDSPTRVVFNSSIGAPCYDQQGKLSACPADEWLKWRLGWLKKVRGDEAFDRPLSGLEEKFVHVGTAGNESLDTAFPWPAAAAYRVAPELRDDEGNSIRLTNTLIVESVTHTASPFAPYCLSDFSNAGGNIAAFGTGVYVSRGPRDPPKEWNGTSLSAPQVAAVAAYIWSLAPTLSAVEVALIIDTTAQDPVMNGGAQCRPKQSARILDAYEAVLYIDETGKTPVRDAILDVDDSSQFDEKDLEVFVEEFELRAGALDYSRYDLNGDGYTQNNTPVEFDLDLDHGISQVTREIQGVDYTFDEAAIYDENVLCYYAYSDLYDGSEEARDDTLAGVCTDYLIDIQVPSGRCPTDEIPISVTALVRDPDTGMQSAAQGPIEIRTTGGSPSFQAGELDLNGNFTTAVTADLGVSELVVEASLKTPAADGGRLLARVSKTASVDQTACAPSGSEECYVLTPSRAVYLDEGTSVSVTESYVSTTVGGVIEQDTTTEATFTCTKNPPCVNPDFQCEYKPRSCAPDPADNPPDDPSCIEYCAWVGTQHIAITQTPANGDPTSGENTVDVVALAPPRGRGPKCRRSDGQYFDWSGTETIEDGNGSATYTWTHVGCKTASQDGGAPALVDYIPLTCCEVPQNSTWVVCAAE